MYNFIDTVVQHCMKYIVSYRVAADVIDVTWTGCRHLSLPLAWPLATDHFSRIKALNAKISNKQKFPDQWESLGKRITMEVQPGKAKRPRKPCTTNSKSVYSVIDLQKQLRELGLPWQ